MPAAMRSVASYRGPRPRVLYTDVDGTLTRNGSVLEGDRGTTLAVVKALLSARRAGIDVVPVSGRTRLQLRELCVTLGLSDYVCELGSAVCHRLGAETHLTVRWTGRHLPAKTMMYGKVWRKLSSTYGDRIAYYAPWHLHREYSLPLRGRVPFGAARRLVERTDPRFTLVDNGRVDEPDAGDTHVYGIVLAGVSKRKGVEYDLDLRGLSAERAVAIGDSPEDASMGRVTGGYFLVGDAHGHERNSLNDAFATKRHYGDGFAEVVRHLARLK
ncbi:MAG: hypothetical protein ACT4PT_06575 [Methanobacteriota archaeon]